jgi:hypothetical protein
VWFYCKVFVHQSVVGGKNVHVLHTRISNTEYMTEPFHNCPEDDSNDKAFVHATTTIGGHDATEEFMACEI